MESDQTKDFERKGCGHLNWYLIFRQFSLFVILVLSSIGLALGIVKYDDDRLEIGGGQLFQGVAGICEPGSELLCTRYVRRK